MITLRKIDGTSTTITLEWDAVPGAVGYRFQSAAQSKWSHTFDPARTTVRFSKAAWYKVEALGVEDAGRYPVVPIPPPTGDPIPANGRISAGGVYSGIWEGTQLTIDTEAPVRFRGADIRKIGGGDVFRGLGGGYTIRNLGLENCHVRGDKGWLWDAEGWDYLGVRNCTIDKTAGMKVSAETPGSVLEVLRNKQKNLQGPNLGGPTLNSFVKLANVQKAAIEIAWNEVINEYNLSEVEDIISCMRTAHMRLHDNYFQGQYAPGNGEGTGSYNAITCEAGDPTCFDNHSTDNQLVSTMGGVTFPSGSRDNLSLRDRVVRSGYLPDGVTKIFIGYSAMYIGVPGGNNHMRQAVVGWVQGSKHGFGRMDYDLPGAPGDVALCTSLPDPVTQATEQAEWNRWQQKQVANDIVVGAA